MTTSHTLTLLCDGVPFTLVKGRVEVFDGQGIFDYFERRADFDGFLWRGQGKSSCEMFHSVRAWWVHERKRWNTLPINSRRKQWRVHQGKKEVWNRLWGNEDFLFIISICLRWLKNVKSRRHIQTGNSCSLQPADTITHQTHSGSSRGIRGKKALTSGGWWLLFVEFGRDLLMPLSPSSFVSSFSPFHLNLS